MPQKRSDVRLISDWKAGNAEGFEELTRRYGAKIYSLALRLTRDSQDAEEVLQDVFLTIYRKIDSFEGKSSFSSWLYRVAFNAALMRMRRRRDQYNINLEEAMSQVHQNRSLLACGDGDTEKAAWRGQLVEALEAAVQTLPDEYRVVFILKDVDGLTSREVAEMLQITVPAVKSRLHRSRLMLRRRLKSLYQEHFVEHPLERAANS